MSLFNPTGLLLIPEAILMIFLAALLDLIGIICLILDVIVGIGEVFSFIPDIMGIFFFGAWLVFRSAIKKAVKGEGEEKKEELIREVAERGEERKRMVKKTRKFLKKAGKRGSKTGLRFGLATLGELIPLLGALPFWTIFVISEIGSTVKEEIKE
ncbi:hypothetical protein KAU51_03240 [Candidatus Parcubacteria bacterium]|nr:hypothetical protein [Candidatus Parcubacteria bacterium]